ncbi:MAG TPA: hypothetical protein VH540_15020 [Ktedonobacterales bacterium]|jgi:hypothetical protein
MDFLGLFIIFAIVVLGIAIFSAVAKQAKIDDLRRNGKWILATVQDIQHKTRHTATGTPPNQIWHTHHYYIVVGTWTNTATGMSYPFSSDELSSHPRYKAGDDVPVLADPNDYSRYHIEI